MDAKVKQVYVHKANIMKMEPNDYSSAELVGASNQQPQAQILHYKRLVVPSNMRSIYWKCYGFPANDDNEILTRSKIVCLLCKSTMTYNRNTTNLRMHLQNKHKSELATLELVQPMPSNKKGDADKRSLKRPRKVLPLKTSPQPVVQVFPVSSQSEQSAENSQAQFIADVDEFNPLTVIVKEATSNSSYTLVDGKAIADAIAEFVILDLQNPDIVEGKGFQRLIGTLKSPCEIPSKALLTDDLIPKIFDVVKEQVNIEVSTLTSNISLSVEDWYSSSGDCYSTVSIHFITNKENELQTRVLSTIYCSDVDTLHWGAQFDAIMDEFNIKVDKVKAIVVASDRDDTIDSLVARGYTIIPCFSYTLQVCARTIFEKDDVLEVLKKCRALVAHISRNSTAMAELRLQDNLHQLEDSPLTLDNANGWMSTLTMIEHLQARRTVLSSIYDCLTSTICLTNSLELTEDDWQVLNDVVSVLSPFKLTISTLVEEKNPLISILKPIMRQLLSVHLEKSPSDSDLCLNLKASLSELLIERYRNPKVNEILELSSALDPRFKNLPFLSEEEKAEIKKNLQTLLQHQVVSAEGNDSSKTNMSKKRLSGMEFLLGELCMTKNEMPISQRTDLELVQYEWESQAELQKSPVEWWREMNGKCYQISHLAWAYLSIPVCARAHLQNTLSPNSLLQNLPTQLALKMKFLHSNYIPDNE
ncbi:zinc finger BED domain-containing protein 1-like isoform X2 [Cimex lectularius]|uniref:BED-type domain-containing protein n=1 Tax=Cimex lectularius TaxID=79782 RepID=A0A8I6RCB5_CIMLE|nr:zinc finger BED domain-containing protein 1-like isoform X2 [Cimex lectularius]